MTVHIPQAPRNFNSMTRWWCPNCQADCGKSPDKFTVGSPCECCKETLEEYDINDG